MIFVQLIQITSSLPTDASALERAISALERDITALESSSVPWERWLPWFTAIVAFGVAMEFWVIWRERLDDMEAWERDVIRPPERPSTKKFAREVVSLLLITGGIVGELALGIEITSINGQLRTKSAELRSKSDQLLALVTQQAGDARNSAEAANTSAGQAQNKANAVSSRTDKLTQELTKDEQGISELEAKRAKLERSLENLAVCSAPRVIPLWSMGAPGNAGTKTAVDSLRAHTGWQFVMEYIPFDAEARRAAVNIAEALKAAGWKMAKASQMEGISDGVEVQAYFKRGGEPQEWGLHVNSQEAAYTLIDFLHSYNWEVKSGWPSDTDTDIPQNGIKIRVGLYPAVSYVSPPGAKGFAAAIAQSEQEMQKRTKQREEQRDKEILKSLTPQQAAEYKARREQRERETRLLIQRYSSPCQPLTPLTPSVR